MKFLHHAAFILVVFLIPVPVVFGQGASQDYERANHLDQLTRNKVFDWKVDPHWFDGGNKFWYRADGRDKREFFVVDAVSGTRRPVFDEAVLASLAKVGDKALTVTDLTLRAIDSVSEGLVLDFDAAGKHWRYDQQAQTLTAQSATTQPTTMETTQPASPRQRRRRGANRPLSPDGNWEAYTDNGNLFIHSADGSIEYQLGDDAKIGDGFDGQFEWSPDSSKLVAMRTKDGDHRKVYLIQSSPKDQLQPKLLSYDYLKPGDQVPISRPHLFDLKERKEIAVKDDLFSNPWSVDDLRWEPDSRRFTFLFNQRGHQALRIIAVDARDGNATAIVDEQSKTFIDYSGKMFVHYLDQTHEIIWMSERDGWNHLYLYDAASGQVKNQITKGSWVVRAVDQVDEENRQIWFQASGIYPGQDPYYIHVCRINFDGSGLVILTQGDGTHAVQYSPDRRFIIDTYSRVDEPPVMELRRTEDGKLICPLEKADISELLKTGWKEPLRFDSKARDGQTDIYGIIYRPTSFDPAKEYPILEDIYAGPQDSFVPKDFSRYRRDQSLAELGFIVVQIDGMGTSNRSKAFHDVCWKNLGDAGLPDRILWIMAAAEKYPFMDVKRVGIFGTSAGGQSALRAVEAFGDFYSACVADCGCHDNRMDKIWWNEQWMGWPVGPEYAAQSNVTNAGKLRGKLLLIVGELDHNVDPASTMQVVNALIKADKDFELLVIPNADHGQDGAYGNRRRQDFFVRNLLGVEPRHG